MKLEEVGNSSNTLVFRLMVHSTNKKGLTPVKEYKFSVLWGSSGDSWRTRAGLRYNQSFVYITDGRKGWRNEAHWSLASLDNNRGIPSRVLLVSTEFVANLFSNLNTLLTAEKRLKTHSEYDINVIISYGKDGNA